MPTFYLSVSSDGLEPNVPAHGLYYYTQTPQGSLEERIIQPNGQPTAAPKDQVPNGQALLPAEQPWPPLDDILPSDWQDWLLVPGATKSYLALKPFARAKPLRIWADSFTELSADTYLLPRLALRATPTISTDLQEAGYAHALASVKNTPFPELCRNASAFWEAGRDICEKLIEHLEYSLDPNGADPPYSLDPFGLPAAIFQLNRMVAEGFIEGHAQAPFQITVSGNYDVASRGDWKRALQRVDQNITPDMFEQLGNETMGAAEREVWDDEQGMMNLLSPTLRLLAPGSGTAEEFAFWYLHYPHWRKDLLNALKTLDGQSITISDHDFDIIKHIILRNYPRFSESLSVWDRILSDFLRLSDDLATSLEIGGATTYFIDPIFDDIIARIKQ